MLQHTYLSGCLLQNGGEFTKFGRRGYPHKRVVCLTEDCAKVVWGEAGSKKPRATASRDCLDSGQVSDVLDGALSDVFIRNVHQVKRPDCCFSIVTPGRTLDLECSSPDEKEMWLTAFLCLRKYGRGL